jgi:hypothetical protein
MSAPACVVYYGLRFEVSPGEVEGLESRTDPRILAARRAGLQFYWGDVAAPEERYVLFVGAPLGMVGPENELEIQLSTADFEALAASVRTNLVRGGFAGDPAIHLQWQRDA